VHSEEKEMTTDNDWLNLALARFEEQIIADDGEPLRVGKLSYREQALATITQHIREAEQALLDRIEANVQGKSLCITLQTFLLDKY
jgi:hypothetical protein